MKSLSPSPALPQAYALKRHIHRYASHFWCSLDGAGVLTAPVYLFPHQASFDADEVQQLSQTIMAGSLRLPHERVLFEVTEQQHPGACLVAYAVDAEQGVDAFLFRFDAHRKVWTDVLARASFLPDGVADVEAHPTLVEFAEHNQYIQALTGLVWRSLGLLSAGTQFREHAVSPLRRASLAKHGVRGWTYRIAEIDTARVAAALALRGGTHAPPRWHIRRGHWRTLADGRRVFVRECEVGDQSRGAVVKDYRVEFGSAA
jgi:hypothetical protein